MGETCEVGCVTGSGPLPTAQKENSKSSVSHLTRMHARQNEVDKVVERIQIMDWGTLFF